MSIVTFISIKCINAAAFMVCLQASIVASIFALTFSIFFSKTQNECSKLTKYMQYMKKDDCDGQGNI